jgi:hypothetical protein
MKISYTILLILITALCVFGQKAPAKKKAPGKIPAKKLVTCEQMLEKVTDKMTDDSYTQSKGSLVIRNGNSGFNVQLFKKDGITLLTFDVIENGRKTCLDKNPEIIFLFTDGTKKNQSGFSKFNCNGVTGVGVDTDDILKDKMVETIRITTAKGYVQADFTPLQAKVLFAEINCLLLSDVK